MSTEALIQHAREVLQLAKGTTPGPWSKEALFWVLRYAYKNSGGWCDVEDDDNLPNHNDAELIAAVPEMVCLLSKLIDALEEKQ